MQTLIGGYARTLDSKRRLTLPAQFVSHFAPASEIALVTATDNQNGLPYVAVLLNPQPVAQGHFMLLKPSRIDAQHRLILPPDFHAHLGAPRQLFVSGHRDYLRIYPNTFSDGQVKSLRRSVDRLLSAPSLQAH